MREPKHIGEFTIIDEPVEFGMDVWIGNYVHIRPNVKIGNWTQIRDYCFISNDVTIGHNTKIFQFCNLSSGMIVGSECFIGAGTMFANDKEPPWPEKKPWVQRPVVVEDRVRIGMGCKILPGVVLAKGCLIGMGAVVTKDTEPYKVYVGNPARVLRELQVTTDI